MMKVLINDISSKFIFVPYKEHAVRRLVHASALQSAWSTRKKVTASPSHFEEWHTALEGTG